MRPPRVSRETLRLLPLVAPVALAGLGATAIAAWTFVGAGHGLTCFLGVLVLLLAALFAEAYPVPVENLPAGRFRHKDHRFEWSRLEFESWAKSVADRFGYSVHFLPVGPTDAMVGAPTQMAVFAR